MWRGLAALCICTACSAPDSAPPAPPPPAAPEAAATPETFTVPAADLFGEGLAWDAARGRLFVGGIVGQSIVEMAVPGDTARSFATPPQPWSVFGLAVDDARGLLFAACAAMPQGRVLPEDVGLAAIVAFSLETGELRWMRRLSDDTPHLFGDLALAPDGTVYVTDTKGGGLYSARLERDGLTTVIEPGTFRSPQGIVVLDNDTVVMADYSTGLHRIEVQERRSTPLEMDPPQDLRGIDGLALRGRTLAAVQNAASPPRVLKLTLDTEGTHITDGDIWVVPDPNAGEPTLATFVEDQLWVMQTDLWPRVFDAAERPREGVDIAPPRIVRVPLGS